MSFGLIKMIFLSTDGLNKWNPLYIMLYLLYSILNFNLDLKYKKYLILYTCIYNVLKYKLLRITFYIVFDQQSTYYAASL